QAVSRLRTPIGHVAFAGGLEGGLALEIGPVMDEEWPPLLRLPTTSEPDVSAADEPLDAVAEYYVHSTHWQTQRVGLNAALEVAKRALMRAEAFVEQQWTQQPGAAESASTWVASARSLMADYHARAQALGVAVVEWVEVIHRASLH